MLINSVCDLYQEAKTELTRGETYNKSEKEIIGSYKLNLKTSALTNKVDV